jgi:hypothetical protein
VDILVNRPKLKFSSIPWVQLKMHKLAFCLVRGKWPDLSKKAADGYVYALSGATLDQLSSELISSNRIFCYITNEGNILISKEQQPKHKFRRMSAEKALELIKTTLLLIQVHES